MSLLENDEPVNMYGFALSMYTAHAQELGFELINFADTTTNNEIRILKAFTDAADAYRFYGFSQTIRHFAETDGRTAPAAVVEMEAEKEREAKKSALALISVLRENGFRTIDINDFADDLKQNTENARLLGQAQALLEMTSK
jgi:hypothetical protein